MEKIGDLIRMTGAGQGAPQESQHACSSCSRTTQGQQELLRRYNPAAQDSIVRDERDCWFGNHPTLAEMERDYGENTPVVWVMAQLYDLNEYTGTRKMDERQVEDAARRIRKNAYHMKVSELMLFFDRVKGGSYGSFYGAVDAMRLGEMLHQFKAERAAAHDRHEREENVRRIDMGREGAISWEEYRRRHNLPEDHTPFLP